MPKLRNGIVVFMRDQVFPGAKMLEFKITNTFPVVSLTDMTILCRPGVADERLEDFDHLSIPPDFRLHLTSASEHIIFDKSPVDVIVDGSVAEPFHFFTVVGLPSARALPLVPPGESREWHEGAIILPARDSMCNDATRLFIDFFLHRAPFSLETLSHFPFTLPGMRLAADRSGAMVGPFDFDDIQRKANAPGQIGFTMRMGYVELDDVADTNYVYTQLNIYKRRPKLGGAPSQ